MPAYRTYLMSTLAVAALAAPAAATAKCKASSIARPRVTVSSDNFVGSTWTAEAPFPTVYITYSIFNNHGNVVATEGTTYGETGHNVAEFGDQLPGNTKHHRRYFVELRISNGAGCGATRRRSFYTK